MDCRYDGSYAGLLSLLQRLFARREQPTRISVDPPTQDHLFTDTFDSPTDPALAASLHQAIVSHLGVQSAENIRYAFLGEQPGTELAIYRYLQRGWQLRRRLDQHLGDSAVANLHRRARRTQREAHRLKGLLRFEETEDGLFYARVRPDANILTLLAGHFCRRLGDRPWLIHDVRRERGALFDGRRWVIGELQLQNAPILSAEEHQWQELWRTFFAHIAIPERSNPRLQRSFLPLKYREFLVEQPEFQPDRHQNDP